MTVSRACVASPTTTLPLFLLLVLVAATACTAHDDGDGKPDPAPSAPDPVGGGGGNNNNTSPNTPADPNAAPALRPGFTLVAGNDTDESIPAGWPGTPAIDGSRVVYVANGSNTWTLRSVLISGGASTKLVDEKTPIPSAATDNLTMTGGIQSFRADHGTVVFRGGDYDSKHVGYYAVPTAGGGSAPLTKIADDTAKVPHDADGKVFGPLIGHTGGSPNGFNIVVGGGAPDVIFNDNNKSGVYSFGHSATGTLIGSADTPICLDQPYGFGGVGAWGSPDVSNDTIAVDVWNVFGHAGVFTIPTSGAVTTPDKCAAPSPKTMNAIAVATATTPVPEDPKGRNFDIWGFGSARIDGDVVVFRGSAQSAAAYDLVGLYAGSKAGGGTIKRLVDTSMDVPGGKGKFQSVNSLDWYALAGTHLVFRGNDEAGHSGIFHVSTTGGGGPITKVVAVDDVLPDGSKVLGNGGGFNSAPINYDSIQVAQGGGYHVALRIDVAPATGAPHSAIYVFGGM